MELGGSHDEMVFGDFESLSEWVDELYKRAKKRHILTPSEHSQLKKIKQKVSCYVDIEVNRIDSINRKITFLLAHFSTYYNQ